MARGFDYAADARGYSWGAVLEVVSTTTGRCASGRFIQPKEPNGQPLDYRIFKTLRRSAGSRSMRADGGPARRSCGFWCFRNHAVMTRYDDALNLAAQTRAAAWTECCALWRAEAKDRHQPGAGALSDDVGFAMAAGPMARRKSMPSRKSTVLFLRVC